MTSKAHQNAPDIEIIARNRRKADQFQQNKFKVRFPKSSASDEFFIIQDFFFPGMVSPEQGLPYIHLLFA